MEVKNKIIEEIRKIYDPELPVNIYELGLIYDIIVEKNKATIDSSKVAGTVFTIISEIATPPAME